MVLGFVIHFDAIGQSATVGKSFTRAEVIKIVQGAREIESANGVDDSRAISINGTRQWISVRGKDLRNPLLLIVHGGPASPLMPDDWTFQTPWEDFFTVVEWDQRGAGKTYALNDPNVIGSTMNVPQMVDDTQAVVEYLLNTYQKKKLFLVAHSWGTVLGVAVAQAHPDWLYAYIGIGQLVNTTRNEEEGYQYVLQEAVSHNDLEAIKELKAIAPYPGVMGTPSLDKIGVQRKWLTRYGGVAWGRQDFKWISSAQELSPDYSEQDLHAIHAGNVFSLDHLLQPLFNINLETTTSFQCPVFLFVGRHDYATSHTLAEHWFQSLRAPVKELVWFENSSHMVIQEEPGRVLDHLVHDVRPIAEESRDAPPADETER